jgi:hypothetical protein
MADVIRYGWTLVAPKVRIIILYAEIGFLTDTPPETIKGEDYQIEYDSDSYPKLPACLDRRAPRLKAA